MLSLWESTAQRPDFPKLKGKIKTDVLIMVIDSRNSGKIHYFATKSLIWWQIFKENLSISIAMNIERIQKVTYLNSQKPIKSAYRNAPRRFDIL